MKRKWVAAAAIVVGVSVSLGAVALAGGGGGENPGENVEPATPVVAHNPIKAHDGDWQLKTYKNTRGESCLAQTMPQSGTGTTCTDKAKMLGGHAIYAIYGGRRTESDDSWDDVFVYGYVGPAVKALTVLALDCSTTEIPLDADGSFSYVVDHNGLVAGRSPYKLMAVGANGNVIDTKKVKAGLPKTPKTAGKPDPQPKPDCA